MPNTPLHFHTITELAALIQSGQLSPVEVTQALLERIAQLDRRYKSYATVMADHALEAAKVAERDIRAGTYRGLLHGVPVAVKDLCYTQGVRTMGGTRVLADHVPSFDATVIARLHAAGAILLGKLNLTEGAMGGYHPDCDIPVNPWHAERYAGASSSGSGVGCRKLYPVSARGSAVPVPGF
jgi:amidase